MVGSYTFINTGFISLAKKVVGFYLLVGFTSTISVRCFSWSGFPTF